MACQSNVVNSCGIRFIINLVREEKDLEDESTYFKPGVMPAIIEDYSGVLGNNTPDIRLSFWSTSLKSLLFTNSVTDVNEEVDKIFNDLNKVMSVNYHNQPKEFLALYDEEYALKPHGDMIYAFEREVRGTKRQFEVYFSEFNTDKFKEFHRRMELFALLFIDGANRIELDDRWCCFIIYEAIEKPKKRLHFVGYSTIYRFFSFPENTRPRISQFVITPPFQRCGVGKQFLRVILKHLIDKERVLEITVEDPCEAFVEMRDIVDAERILTVRPSLVSNILNRNYCKGLINEIHTRLRIPTNRIRRMYEIVKLYLIIKNDSTKMEQFKEELETRLTSEHNRAQQLTSRQRRHGMRCLALSNVEHSNMSVDVDFKYLLSQYDSIVMKLINSEDEWAGGLEDF